MSNDIPFLLATLDGLASAGIQAWVFGGWAEELWRIIPPRIHRDVDLLLPAQDFDLLDRFLAAAPGVNEFQPKHFSHKRAYLRENIMVELILVGRYGDEYQTDFFSGVYRFTWPPDTFNLSVASAGRALPVASPAALSSYRDHHAQVAAGYAAYNSQ